jgi:hypothetical protein
MIRQLRIHLGLRKTTGLGITNRIDKRTGTDGTAIVANRRIHSGLFFGCGDSGRVNFLCDGIHDKDYYDR